MTTKAPARLNTLLLNSVAYLTIAGVGLVSWFTLDDPGQRWAALGLIVAFGLINFYVEARPNHVYSALYFAIQTGLTSALLLIEARSFVFNVLFFILSAEAMVTLPARRGLMWIGLFCLISALAIISQVGPIGLLYALPNFGGYAFFGAFGNVLRETEDARRRNEKLLHELRAAQQQLQELAVVDERNRLAREMHDTLGHRLTVAVVQLEGAQRLIPTDPERAARMIGAMREQMKEALADLRRTVAALRAPLIEDLPLQAALTRLAQEFQEGTGLAVQLQLPPDLPPLSAAQRLTLYRAAQESFTNTQRHAQASQIWLRLQQAESSLTLTAADNGQGFPADLNGEGYGLRGLRERVAQLGGQLHLESRSGGGAQLRMVLPLEAASHADAHSARG
jgi:signal transduction histidine kinase